MHSSFITLLKINYYSVWRLYINRLAWWRHTHRLRNIDSSELWIYRMLLSIYVWCWPVVQRPIEFGACIALSRAYLIALYAHWMFLFWSFHCFIIIERGRRPHIVWWCANKKKSTNTEQCHLCDYLNVLVAVSKWCCANEVVAFCILWNAANKVNAC